MREIPTRTVSHCRFSQSIIHTSIRWFALREKKEKNKIKLQGFEKTREKGERQPLSLSCAG